MKGILSREKEIKAPIYGEQQQPVQAQNKPEQRTSAVDFQPFSTRFHVTGYSGRFINIPGTFHWLWILLCCTSNRTNSSKTPQLDQ